MLPLTQFLRRLASEPASDAALLARFAHHGDQDAFTALVERHGPMVLHACRRVLGDVHAAEDAFQATFLVLARKAHALRRPDALAAWLHGVAYRVAMKGRGWNRRLPRTTAADAVDPRPDPLAEVSARELLVALEEEDQR
jgi:DNA-directed RNA polymerase specialized sigma24 family protein